MDDVEVIRSVEIGEGFELQRLASGDVRVRKCEPSGASSEKTVRAEVWAQVVATVSAGGADVERTARAFEFHESA